MNLDTEYAQNNELCTEHFTITTDTEFSPFDQDLQTLKGQFKPIDFWSRWEEAKAALLEIRIVAFSVKHFNRVREGIYHYCPQAKHLFHPVDFMYSCLEPKTSNTNALFAKTITQLKFLTRNPLVIAVTSFPAIHLAYETVCLWNPIATGLFLSVYLDISQRPTWLARITFSAFVLLAGTEAPLSVAAACVSTVAFSRIPSLIRFRQSLTNYFKIVLNPNKPLPQYFITQMYDKAWAEFKKRIKERGAEIWDSISKANVGSTN